MNDVLKGTLVLFCILCVSIAILVFMNAQTNPLIEKNNQEKLDLMLTSIFPDSDDYILKKITYDEGQFEYYEIYEKNQLVGYAVESDAVGYQSTINLLVGLDVDKKIKSVLVLEQSETPGLGTRIVDESFLSQFIGKAKSQTGLKKDGGEIDAISGATVSSRAFTKAVQEAFDILE